MLPNVSRDHESLISSSSRPLGLRMRPDLACTRQTYQGRDYWVVKDPIGLKYYRFEEEEFALLKMLDGRSSADEIQFQFNQKFAPQKIALNELFQLAGMLHRSSLLISDSTNQGRELCRRSNDLRRRARRTRWTNILAFQFRGFDPDRLLTWLTNRVGWFFAAPMLGFNIAFGIAAAALMLTHWGEVQNRLPGFQEFFSSGNWFWLALTLALTKVLHEFGHGICCKRYGGQCHEMGFMLLVMTPCLYVNVSDAWTLPSKWQRIAIAAAGMYVELFLASLAVFLWWFTEPGLLNQLALNAIFVCSVSTLVFNANPLMKYDGYYILSDLLEIPNLRQKSTTLVQRGLSQYLLGIESLHDPFLPQRHRWLFAAYSIASIAYRWLVTISIFFFFYTVLEPHGFKVVGQLLALLVIAGLLLTPLIQAIRYFSVPGRSTQVKKPRAIIAAIGGSLVLILILAIPLPHWVSCELSVQPRGSETVYVKAAGRVKRILAEPNQWVQAGEVLLELDSSNLEEELAQLNTQANVASTRLRSAMLISNSHPKYSADVDTANASYVSLSNLANQRRKDLEQLIVRAPVSGTLLAGDFTPKPSDDEGRLISWYGRALDRRNIGALLLEGTTIGQIVPDATKLEAILAVDQGDIEFIGPDQLVEIWIRQSPSKTFLATTGPLSMVEMKSVPACLSNKYGGGLATTTTPDNVERPTSTTYRVSVPFDDSSESIAPGSSGRAMIRVGYRSLGQRAWRLVCKTFRFDL